MAAAPVVLSYNPAEVQVAIDDAVTLRAASATPGGVWPAVIGVGIFASSLAYVFVRRRR